MIVDEDALYAALKDGHLAGRRARCLVAIPHPGRAGPEASRRPFHELANVLITPHSSNSSTERDRRQHWSVVAVNLYRLARGEPLENIVLET